MRHKSSACGLRRKDVFVLLLMVSPCYSRGSRDCFQTDVAQFEDAYWERGDNWNYTAAALQGSSYYKLPRILQWFSGNIGHRTEAVHAVRVPILIS